MFSRYLGLLLLPSLAAAYSFNIENTPRQCQNLTVNLTGSGSPPYSLLLVPFGPSPLSTGKESRKILQQNFTGSSVSFLLNYPTDSQFVLQISDSTGFGSGGATAAVTVLDGPDSSCFDPNNDVSPGFVYSLVPNSLQQCAPTRFWWDPNAGTVKGSTPFFAGIIPGGQSLMVPQGSLTTVPEQGLGFSWTPSIRAGTTVLIIAGDNRGIGSGGSSTYIIGFGDGSCLDSGSPSSTPGSPAGGSYPTSTSGAGTGGSTGGSHSNTGPIVGGVVGGVVGLLAILLVALFFYRRRRFHKQQKKRPVDLLHDQEGEDQDGHPPQYYQPEPFVVPEPTVVSEGAETSTIPGAARPSLDQRRSHYSNLSGERSSTPDQSAVSGSTYLRKSPAPPSFRAVNIVQHDDAGPSEPEPETIELPPAYTNIRGGGTKAPADGTHDASSSTTPSPPAVASTEPALTASA
ncbi:hypothetical protein BDW22DRAFT_1352763 [Trametopsis cervina]|nr:hypothetical protein BDW22DRAFT_1352763 [Trametopsis cervina]